MGNSPSVEAPRRGSKAAHKLSKPRMGNTATAGLLSPKALPESTRQSPPTTKHLSLPSSPAPASAPAPIFTPVPSPKLPGKDAETMASLMAESNDGGSGDRTSRRMSRSGSFREPPRHQRSNSVGVIASPQVRCRPVRANSVNIGPDESYAAHFNLQSSLSRNVSRTSVNYDLASYEAKRLLNLAEEPSREHKSTMPDGHFQPPEVAWKANPDSRPLPTSSTSTPLPRANSDLSLYTPMRRRSLMTPGVATRTTPSYPGPPMPRTRFSLPSTPSRRDSLESTGAGLTLVTSSNARCDLIPRALTPCEAEYKQTGAFKLGTLRIINGSPVTTPTVDSSDDEDEKQGPKQTSEQRNRYHIERKVAKGNAEDRYLTSVGVVGTGDHLVRPRPIHPSSPKMESGGSMVPTPAKESVVKSEASLQFSSHLVHSPLPIISADPESPGLQVTSKHTAAEDQLFEDEPHEYDVEVLDVRVDPSAKSIPSQQRLSPDEREPGTISRSDSGIVASPTSECSQKPLSKADSGYSSNVSVRSLSSKIRGQEKDSPQEPGSSETSAEMARGGISPPVVTQSVTSSIPNVTISRPEENMQPSVPEKARPGTSPINRPVSQESPTDLRQKVRLAGSKSSLKKTVVPLNSSLEPPEPSPSSSTSSSAGSMSSLASRKLGKLQRLLSGTRTPKAVTEESDVPRSPRSGLLPESLKKLTLKPKPSKETLGTIVSVGSIELLHERLHERETVASQDTRDNHHSSSRKEVGPRKRRSTLRAYSFSSTISRAASVLSRKSVNKKANPDRDIAEQGAADPLPAHEIQRNKQAQAPDQIAIRQGIIGKTLDFAYLGTATRGQDCIEPISKRSRSASISVHMERNLPFSSATSRPSTGPPQGELRSLNSLEVPQFANHVTGSRTPPPVSMRTRNMGSLPALPPVRSQSTPPGTVRARGRPSLSRGMSLEENGGVPVVYSTPQSSGTLSRRPSGDSASSYSTAQEEVSSGTYFEEPSSMDPRRFTIAQSQLRAPNWEVQADHGPPSRQSSRDRSRHNSLVSRSSQQSSSIVASRSGNPPVLKPRSSHDGYVVPESFAQDNGPYPSMVRSNGQKFVSDPWSGQPVLQQLPQFDQYGQHPPHLPRGHFRHRSSERNMHGAPYRVLHSYNSPAYRHVPIWG